MDNFWASAAFKSGFCLGCNRKLKAPDQIEAICKNCSKGPDGAFLKLVLRALVQTGNSSSEFLSAVQQSGLDYLCLGAYFQAYKYKQIPGSYLLLLPDEWVSYLSQLHVDSPNVVKVILAALKQQRMASNYLPVVAQAEAEALLQSRGLPKAEIFRCVEKLSSFGIPIDGHMDDLWRQFYQALWEKNEEATSGLLSRFQKYSDLADRSVSADRHLENAIGSTFKVVLRGQALVGRWANLRLFVDGDIPPSFFRYLRAFVDKDADRLVEIEKIYAKFASVANGYDIIPIVWTNTDPQTSALNEANRLFARFKRGVSVIDPQFKGEFTTELAGQAASLGGTVDAVFGALLIHLYSLPACQNKLVEGLAGYFLLRDKEVIHEVLSYDMRQKGSYSAGTAHVDWFLNNIRVANRGVNLFPKLTKSPPSDVGKEYVPNKQTFRTPNGRRNKFRK